MNNQQKILECALALFAERGYDAIGVQEIVENAGVTKPTLYHYFGSKRGLLEALLDKHYEEFDRLLVAAASYRGDLPLTLRRIAEAYFRYALDHPTYYRLQLALGFAPQQSEAFQAVSSKNEHQFSLVENVFAAAVRDHGNMRGRQRIYATTFIGVLNACIVLALNGYARLDDRLLERVVHQFEHGIYS